MILHACLFFTQQLTIPRDPHTFSGGTWALQAYINSLQSPSEQVLGSLGNRHGIDDVFGVFFVGR